MAEAPSWRRGRYGHAVRSVVRHPASGPRIPAVGRLVSDKDFAFLIRTVPSPLTEFPDLTFQIAGEGPRREQLEGLTTDLGVTRAVRFSGFVPNIQDLLAIADCFLMPSRTEGVPTRSSWNAING